MDGSPSVSELYLMRDTAVSRAFLQRRKKPHIVMVASPALAGLIYHFSTFGPRLVLCKVVGTHRVLHLGSIERERVTRERASDVPYGYYGMVYLGGVYTAVY